MKVAQLMAYSLAFGSPSTNPHSRIVLVGKGIPHVCPACGKEIARSKNYCNKDCYTKSVVRRQEIIEHQNRIKQGLKEASHE